MKVNELIKLLEQMPQDYDVMRFDDELDIYLDVDDAEIISVRLQRNSWRWEGIVSDVDMVDEKNVVVV